MSHIRTFSRDKDLVNLRREQIARSSARIFVKKGYHNSSVREIAKVCRMSIGSLYHYVGAKEDILSLVFQYVMFRESQFNEMAHSFATLTSTEALRKAIDVYIRGIDDIQDMVLLGYQDSKNLQQKDRERTYEQEERIINVFERILSRGCETGEFKVNDITLVATNIVIIGDQWAFRRWLLAKRYTLDEYIRKQTNIIMDGIRSHTR